MSGNDNQYGGFGGQMSGGVSYDSPQTKLSSQPASVQDHGNEKPAPTKGPDGLLNLGGVTSAEPVLDISTADFKKEVIDDSASRPVLIDFWAPWCGPCKQLAPALESAVAKAGGKVKLVKMNIEEYPEIAGQMGIQSIPAVVAFVSGQPKDAFMGAKSEKEIDQFIEKLVGPSGPSQLELALEQADMLAGEEAYEEAAQIYNAILAQQPDNLDAVAGFGMIALKTGNLDQAKAITAGAERQKGHRGLDALNAAIALQEQAEGLGDLSEMKAQLEANPNNKDLRFDLAIALNAAGQTEEAADHLLEIIAKDRSWRDDGAKAQLLQFFEAWGPTDPVTLYGRRRLSSILFS
ncbi:MAG: thioredoxin [Salaquimonas sp.]